MYKSIVVGTDGSETAKVAVQQAAELAEAQGAELHLVMSGAPSGNQPVRSEQAGVPDDVAHSQSPNQDIDARLREVEEGLPDGLNVIRHAKQGDPADAII